MHFISSTETLVHTKTCKHCGTGFPITDQDLEFYEKISPVFAGAKYPIPTPTLCPDCRRQRRLSFRNDRKLYKRKCDATGKDIVSIYSPDKPFKVYHQDEWWSDKWDPLSYGRDFDFNRPFFEQFGKLYQAVPKLALFNANNENCEYNNFIQESKDCYMSFRVYYGCENIINSFYVLNHCSQCCDSSWITNSSHLCECSDVFDSTRCVKLVNSENCFNCNFSYGLKNCSNCLLCVNLVNKEYCIENIQYSKEDFFNLISAEYSRYEKCNEAFSKKLPNAVRRCNSILNSENSTGDYVHSCKNVTASFGIGNSMDIRHSADVFDSKDCGDILWMGFWEVCYEAINVTRWRNIVATSYSVDISASLYSMSCHSSSHLFGSVGLRNKEYCILNRQYTKEEYETLVPKIIEHMIKTGEWGEFFPSSISPFGYNETVAQEYYPMTREGALAKGFTWSDYEPPFPKVEKTIPASKLPENIEDVPDDILNWAIECEVTKKPFRIIKQELEFYRKHHLPIPKRHPDQRHLDRMALRNPRKLFERKCDKCGKEMITTYAPERPETVYCEGCYIKEVV